MADPALDDFMASLLDGLTENDLDFPPSSPAVCSQPGAAASPRPSQTVRKTLLRERPPNQLAKLSRPVEAAPLKPQTTAQPGSRQDLEGASTFPHRSQTSRNAARPTSSSRPSAPAAQHKAPRPSQPVRPHVVKAQVSQANGPSKAVKGAVSLKATPSATPSDRSALDAQIASLLEGCDSSAFDVTEDDFALAPAPPLAPPTESVHLAQRYLRCQVEDDVEEASYVAERKRLEKRVLVRATLSPTAHGSTSVTRDCILTLADDWSATRVTKGSTFNVLALPPHSLPDLATTRDQLVLSRKNPSLILVLQPDTLVSATTIASASSCLRRSILQEKIRSQRGDVSEAVVSGNVVHEVVQAMLWRDCRANDAATGPDSGSARDWTLDDLLLEARRACQRHLNDLFMLGKSVDEGVSMVSAKLQPLPAWSRQYVKLGKRQQPPSSGTPVAITAVLDTEEDVWSPAFGLKGKIDVSVRARLAKSGRAWERDECGALMPLEIKTGRNVAAVEHRAQTMLYTLLMSDRYDTPVTSGLLFYTQDGELTTIDAHPRDLAQLMMTRNALVGYLASDRFECHDQSATSADPPAALSREVSLPEPIHDDRLCTRCYVNDGCMLYQKTAATDESEADAEMPAAVAEVFERKTSHLTERDADFFRKWDRLISLEEKEAGRFRGEIWRMTATQRQKFGRAFANMLVDQDGPGDRFQSKDHRFDIHRFTYRLRPARGALGDAVGSLLSGHMVEHDPVVVSSEGHKVGLARGFILELTPSSVVVGVDHPLPQASAANTSLQPLRIDKDELQAGLGRLRDNLARLFYADGDERRRSLIVDLRPPRFLDTDATNVTELSHLNEEQRDAVVKVMSAQDYALVMGVPGAGKTSTVAQIIRSLVGQGKTILLTSYTHSAVDTIAVKLVEAGVDLLRLGHRDKVDPRLLDNTLDDKSITTVESLEARMLRPPVVAATSLAINHPLFSRRHFDYCIVDEASQITLPTCLGPLRLADRFVLVGDHHQLPPLVKSASARVGGMDVSLFKLLSEAHPSAMVELTRQYRMNEDIMSLSNALVYDGKLRCGNEEVASRVLRLPKEPSMRDLHGAAGACSRCWIAELLRAERKVVFVDTDKLPAKESRVGNLIQNEVEAGLIYQLTQALASCGLEASETAIITPYRQQIKLLRYLFGENPSLEILTADKAQGRDKECVIMSMVRSNDVGQVGDLLRDWRRINVAVTRARSKLLLFGSRSTLARDDLLAQLLQLIESRGWLYELPPDAYNAHQPLAPSGLVSSVVGPDPPRKRSASSSPRPPPSTQKRSKLGLDAMARGRPILKDILGHL